MGSGKSVPTVKTSRSPRLRTWPRLKQHSTSSLDLVTASVCCLAFQLLHCLVLEACSSPSAQAFFAKSNCWWPEGQFANARHEAGRTPGMRMLSTAVEQQLIGEGAHYPSALSGQPSASGPQRPAGWSAAATSGGGGDASKRSCTVAGDAGAAASCSGPGTIWPCPRACASWLW